MSRFNHKISLFLIFTVLLLNGCNLPFIPTSEAEESTLAPKASFFVDPPTGSITTTFQFDASSSIDNRGLTNGLKYRFNFDISTEEYTPWQGSPKFSHKYTTAGVKRVVLEIQDIDGLFDKTNVFINVRETNNFNAYLKVNPTQGNVNTTFNFFADITTTLDQPAETFLVRFDFDGDGDFDTPFQKEKSASFTFPEATFYIPRIEVKAKTGETILVTGYETNDGSIGQIRVTGKEFPGASIQVYPRIGYTESQFTFDASNSFDYQRLNDKFLYRWDFENDGTFDSDYLSNPVVNYHFSTPGIKKVVVEIKNPNGLTDKASTTVLVQDRDFAPEIKIAVTGDNKLSDRTSGTTATDFTFRISGRDDHDQLSKIRVRYDFESDGRFDTSFSARAQTVRHRFDTHGEKLITVEARDSSGNSSFVTTKVNVIKNTAPKAVLEVDRLQGTTANEFKFSIKNSQDFQYKSNLLEARFDFDGDGIYDTAFKRVSLMKYKFATPGIKNVKVQVRDPEGLVSESTKQVEVLANSKPKAILEVTPLSKEGTYNTSFTLNAGRSYDGQTPPNKLKYRWDYEYLGSDDASFGSNFSTTFKRNFRYKSAGQKTVRVQVMDENSEIDEAFATININWSSPYLEALYRKGIIRGYQDRDLKPDKLISRAEMFTMIIKAKKPKTANVKFTDRFSDVGKKDWFWRYVFQSVDLGYAEGYGDRTFRPNSEVSRANAVYAIMKSFKEKQGYQGAAKNFKDVPSNIYYTESVKVASMIGIVEGYPDNTFHPNDSVTRGEFAKMLYMAMQKME